MLPQNVSDRGPDVAGFLAHDDLSAWRVRQPVLRHQRDAMPVLTAQYEQGRRGRHLEIGDQPRYRSVASCRHGPCPAGPTSAREHRKGKSSMISRSAISMPPRNPRSFMAGRGIATESRFAGQASNFRIVTVLIRICRAVAHRRTVEAHGLERANA